MSKYKLTNNKIEHFDKVLYQIQALKDFRGVRKGDLGGWIEKEDNLSQEGLCWVYGNAQVYGDAKLCAKLKYKNGWFIGGDDSMKITNITDKTGTDYWKAQYVLGNYEIEKDEPKK